jgi:hypothetical protein
VESGQGALPATAEAAHQLKKAAGIGRDDGLRAHVEKMTNFAIAKLSGGIRLEEVIHACRTAAERGLGELGNFKLRNFGEQLAGLLVNPLRVSKMASVVISDTHWQGISWCNGFHATKDFSDVFAFCGEGVGAISPLRIVAEKVAVLLHRRAAAGGVDGDRVNVGGFEESYEISGHGGGLVVQT